MRWACRRASAVSLGAMAKRLSKRPHIADRRAGVTKPPCLGRGAENDESWGGCGDAISCWSKTEKSKSVFTLCIWATATVSYSWSKVPKQDQTGQLYNLLSACFLLLVSPAWGLPSSWPAPCTCLGKGYRSQDKKGRKRLCAPTHFKQTNAQVAHSPFFWNLRGQSFSKFKIFLYFRKWGIVPFANTW